MIKQVYGFEAPTIEKLSERVNAFLTRVRSPLVLDVKYQATWDDTGIKHSALVITEEQEKPRTV